MPHDEVDFMTIDRTDWASMDRAQQIHQLEVEGYLALPGILPADTIAAIKNEMSDAEMWNPSYSTCQTRSAVQPQWTSPAAAELIGFPPMIDFLSDLLGPGIVFTRGFFQRSLPGCPGISLHTDGQPHGSNLFGWEGSCPRLLRVLYYLDELTEIRAPFRLVPRSHACFHTEANPYARYISHPEEVTLIVPQGTAVIVPNNLMHGSHPNLDQCTRELVQFGYRPAWAGPIQPVDEWDQALVEAAPAIAKPFLQSLNTSGHDWNQQDKPQNMAREAPGMNPSRWEN
jgi:hypothetical protein